MLNIETNRLSSLLAENACISEEEASLFLESFSSVVVQALRKGEEVEVLGLGKFVVIDTQQSQMRRVALMLSDVMKNEINSPFAFFEPCVIADGKIEKSNENVENDFPEDTESQEPDSAETEVPSTETEVPSTETEVPATETEVPSAETEVPPAADESFSRKEEEDRHDSFVRRYLRNLATVLLKVIVPLAIVFLFISLCNKQTAEPDTSVLQATSDTLSSDTTKVEVAEPDSFPSQGIMLDCLGNPVTVKPLEGDMLTTIAQQHLGNKAFWPYLFWVNRDVLSSPSALITDQILKLPDTEYFSIDANDQESIDKANDFGIKLIKQ